MKLKLIPMLGVAISLAFAATPLVVKAAPAKPGQLLLAQATPQQESGPFASLNLSNDQKSQLREIRKQTHQQMENILTAEQKTQIQQIKQQNRQQTRQQIDNILTAEQKTQIQQIKQQNRQQTRQEIDKILTAEQKSQIQQIKQSSRDKINSVLTDTQRQQLQQIKSQRAENGG